MDSAWIPNLFLDYESSDVQLRIDTTAQDCEAVIPAHSLVLKFASKVFRAMLETSNFMEGRTGIVELKVKGDMDDAIFFLRYLYTRDLEYVDMNVYISVLETAHLYEVDDLVRLCNERIREQLSPLTVCKVFRSFRHVASECLLSYCKDLMLEFAFLIFQKNLHLTLDEQTMAFLLASDELNVFNEEQVLSALWRWGCTRLALKKCPELDVGEDIKDLSVLIRRDLIGNVQGNSPWFRLWKSLKPGTEGSGYRIRIPNQSRGRDLLERFYQVACVAQMAGEPVQTKAESKNCLTAFSAEQDILFAGFKVQVTLTENLPSENIFQFSMDRGSMTQVWSPEVKLVYEYQKRRTIAPPSIHSFILMNSLYNQSSQVTVEDHIYVYELTTNLRTPIELKMTERTILNLHIKQMPRSGVSLSSCKFQDHTLNFNQNFKVRFLQETIAVSQLYYLV